MPFSDILSRLTVDRGRTPYDLLPTSSARAGSPKGSNGPCRSCLHVLFVRRRLRTVLLVLALLVTASVAAVTYVRNYPLPPLYSRFHQAELALPQHDASLPLPEGGHGRYLWIANHASSESLQICNLVSRVYARAGFTLLDV